MLNLGMDITNTALFKEFKNNLTRKRNNNIEYYYITIHNSITTDSKQIYLGRVTDNEKKLFDYFIKTTVKRIIFSFEKMKSIKYTNKYISDDIVFFLDLLRLSYSNELIQYRASDIQKYEDTIFTRYVTGTTNVEGNTYTERETDLTLNQGLTVKGKEIREFYEIINYKKWKKYLDSLNSFNYDRNFIKMVHYYLLMDIDTDAGEFRNTQVFITGTSYQPSPAILVETELDELLKWYNDNKTKVYPIELISLFHQRFEEIHPFSDGNGRVGRELMRLQLRDFNFPTIFINKKNREDYLKCLDAGNEDNYGNIVVFIAGLLIDEYQELFGKLIETSRDTLDLIDQDKVMKNEFHEFIGTMMKYIDEFVKSAFDDFLNILDADIRKNFKFDELKMDLSKLLN